MHDDDTTPGALPAAAGGRAPRRITKRRLVTAACFAVVALLSLFVAGHFASQPESYANTIASLDAKKDTVMSLVAGSTATSSAITLLPGDAGTPIAEKLVDMSSDFLVVITAIYLEKYLLTVLGFAAFRVLVPVGCALIAAAMLLAGREKLGETFVRLGARLVLFGLAVFLVVPVSVGVSNMIESTYQASIDQTLQAAQQTQENIENSTDGQGSGGDGGDQGIANPLDLLQQIPSGISGLADQAQGALNSFIEALAVMIVTSCVIPILVLLFFLWLVKTILGVDIDAPLRLIRPRTFPRKP